MNSLDAVNDAIRERMFGYRHYNENDQYGPTHPDAISDGDAKGRGELRGSVGTSIDIAERNQQVGFNRYGEGRPYDVTRD